jgi:hypothetical protein
MSFAEKLLDCVECKKIFTFTVKEQEFRCSQGYPNEPVRCRPCRQARKTSSTQNENGVKIKFQSDSYFR